jgi:hypothetical protein
MAAEHVDIPPECSWVFTAGVSRLEYLDGSQLVSREKTVQVSTGDMIIIKTTYSTGRPPASKIIFDTMADACINKSQHSKPIGWCG